MVADHHLATAALGQFAVGLQAQAAGGEHSVRPQLDGAQFALFAVQRKQEKDFQRAVNQAAGDAEQALGEAQGIVHDAAVPGVLWIKRCR